jgi:hypothetical protein
MRVRSIVSIALIATLALGLTGCEQIKKAITPPPTINQVTIKAKVASPDATIVGTFAEKVPANLPVWPDSTLLRDAVTKGSNGKSWSATFESKDLYDDIVTGTAKGFQDASWQVMQQDISSAEASVTVFTVSSGDAEGVVTVTAQPDKTTTRIGYVITTAK